MLFYIDKIGYPCKYDDIASGYRCWTDNKDASRHGDKKIRNTTNHMGTALDIYFKFEANKSYDDIRKDIFCKYMGAPLKTIKVYDELTAYESCGPVQIDTLKTSTYKIQDDGMIKEIK